VGTFFWLQALGDIPKHAIGRDVLSDALHFDEVFFLLRTICNTSGKNSGLRKDFLQQGSTFNIELGRGIPKLLCELRAKGGVM